MSDCVLRDNLWQHILETHWQYLVTEESIAKLENRKKLEDSLKELLCIVPHDRKFFLSETATVLKNSVQDLQSFNAQKGITAFESISQYANNLFTKPWRKEFRVLKLYSGFYQHEINSNLLGAEILFEAMGYRRLSDNTLILDRPICPDQVSNVSRDAMIAYVELQIIKHIYKGLEAVGINCSWLNIYHHREHFTGGASQAIKTLASTFEEKRARCRERCLIEDNYGYINTQPPSSYYAASSQYYPSECQWRIYQQGHQLSRQRPIARSNGVCCVPEEQMQSLTLSNLGYSNMPYSGYQHNQYHHQNHHVTEMPPANGAGLLSYMSHSRSLEHYTEPSNHYNNMLPHRHSFDHQDQGCTPHHQYHNSQPQKHQQQHYYQHVNKMPFSFYEQPYDCIDGSSLGGGSSNISYAAVSANAGPGVATAGVGNGSAVANCNLNPTSTYSHSYNVSGNRFPLPSNISHQLVYDNPPANNYNDIQEPTYAHIADSHLDTLKSKFSQNLARTSSMQNYPNNNQSLQNPKNSVLLINLDDATILSSAYDSSNLSADKHANMRNNRERLDSASASPAIGQQDYDSGRSLANNDTYVYAHPVPRESRKQNASTSNKYAYNTDATDVSYDSAHDDFANLTSSECERQHQNHSPQSTKTQEGVGSVELWNNVYQNVEKKGYSKEVGEREDFLVQSLDLDSVNINNDVTASQNSSAEKRKSFYSGNENKTVQPHEHQKQLEAKTKCKTIENAKYVAKKPEKSFSSASASNTQKSKPLLDNNTKKVKSAPKQTNLTSKTNSNQCNDNKPLSKIMNNNNNDHADISTKDSTRLRKPSSSAGNERKRAPSVTPTQIIVTSANEWSCKQCTFINPDSKRICEMCSCTKDSPRSSDGGTTTMAQNTPTCV